MQRRDFLKTAACGAPLLAAGQYLGQPARTHAASGDTDSWTLAGIAELRCWFNHLYRVPEDPAGRHAEDCLDAHLEAGIRFVIWELGRSVLAYHSQLPDATCWGLHDQLGKLGERIELERMFRHRCQLRAALEHAREKDIVLYGRLCMNRNYSPGFKRSRVHNEHPEWRELSKNGRPDPTRLCFGLPEYRRERIAILVEAAEIGCHGLHLDFCRQPPIVRYHPVLVDSYREKHGVDPRDSSLADADGFLRWCRFRADSVTTFLRELKAALDQSKILAGRQVPIHVRIPNDGLQANLICGLDVARWCEEGLVDELSPSKLNWLAEYQHFDDGPYIELGERYGLPVYCGVSFNSPTRRSGNVLAGANALVFARRVLAAHQAALAGVVFYQSDTGVQLPGFRRLLPQFQSKSALEELLADRQSQQQWPVQEDQQTYGIDHHSFFSKFKGIAGREGNGA